MNDYFNSLFTRSFSLDNNTQTVRPRLPSMFENQSIDHLTIGTFSNETQQDQDNDELNFMAKRRSFTPHSIETRVDSNDEDGGYQDQTAPHGIPEHSEVNAQSKKPNPTNPLTRIRQSTTRDLNQEQSVVYKPNSQNVETNHSSFPLPDGIQPTQTASRQGIKLATSSNRLDKSESNQEIQRPQATKQVPVLSPTNLIVDSALLDRLVTEKMVLSDNKKYTAIRDKDVTKTSQQPSVFIPQDISKLNIQWPQTAGKTQSLNLKKETVSEQAEPIINVTIGRVEIRATQTLANSEYKSQTPKSSNLSLEEFLNKRNGNAK